MTGFAKTNRVVTVTFCNCVLKNVKVKYSRHCSSLMLGCSHARFAPELIASIFETLPDISQSVMGECQAVCLVRS